MNATNIDPLALPSVPLEMRSLLPATPSVYLVLDALDQVQYVGRSTNPQQRWVNHHRYGQLSDLDGVRIAWLEVSEPELLPEIEKALIDWFHPPLNGAACPSRLGENSASVSAIISKEQKEKLTAIAKNQRRSVSQLLSIVIEEWLEQQREEREAS